MPRKNITAVAARLWKPVRAWLRAIDDRRALAELPDYLLKDIGLRRDQIDAGAAGAWREEAAVAPAASRPTLKVIAAAPAARLATKTAAPKENLAA